MKQTISYKTSGVCARQIDLVVEDGIMTSIIFMDWGTNGAYDGPEAGAGSAVASITVTVGLDVSYVIAEGATVDATDLADAIQAAMAKAGYAKVTVDLSEDLVTAEKDGQTLKLDIVSGSAT